MKICTKCFVKKKSEEFYIDKSTKDGRRPDCKLCYSKVSKNYRITERSKRLNRDRQKKYRDSEEGKKYHKEYLRKYQVSPRHRKYWNDRYHNDIQFRLRDLLRARLRRALDRGYKSGSAVKDLGCSVEEFKEYLESKFQTGMSWENYGEWHIDHIKPLVSFNLSDREQLIKAVHFTNLQPLWARDNFKKGYKNLCSLNSAKEHVSITSPLPV